MEIVFEAISIHTELGWSAQCPLGNWPHILQHVRRLVIKNPQNATIVVEGRSTPNYGDYFDHQRVLAKCPQISTLSMWNCRLMIPFRRMMEASKTITHIDLNSCTLDWAPYANCYSPDDSSSVMPVESFEIHDGDRRTYLQGLLYHTYLPSIKRFSVDTLEDTRLLEDLNPKHPNSPRGIKHWAWNYIGRKEEQLWGRLGSWESVTHFTFAPKSALQAPPPGALKHLEFLRCSIQNAILLVPNKPLRALVLIHYPEERSLELGLQLLEQLKMTSRPLEVLDMFPCVVPSIALYEVSLLGIIRHCRRLVLKLTGGHMKVSPRLSRCDMHLRALSTDTSCIQLPHFVSSGLHLAV